jgi:hypothetical protein
LPQPAGVQRHALQVSHSGQWHSRTLSCELRARRFVPTRLNSVQIAEYALVTCRALGLSVALGYTNMYDHDRRELFAPFPAEVTL